MVLEQYIFDIIYHFIVTFSYFVNQSSSTAVWKQLLLIVVCNEIWRIHIFKVFMQFITMVFCIYLQCLLFQRLQINIETLTAK